MAWTVLSTTHSPTAYMRDFENTEEYQAAFHWTLKGLRPIILTQVAVWLPYFDPAQAAAMILTLSATYRALAGGRTRAIAVLLALTAPPLAAGSPHTPRDHQLAGDENPWSRYTPLTSPLSTPRVVGAHVVDDPNSARKGQVLSR